MNYDAQTFSDLATTPLGRGLWKALMDDDNLIRMETATYLGRVAVEPLGPILLAKFGVEVRRDRVKQMIGHMARQVMYARGYRIDRGNVRTIRKELFVSGTRYTKATSDE